MQGVPGMQFERRCAASSQSAGASDRLSRPNDSIAPLRAAAPVLSLFALLTLGVVPAPVRTVASAEAQSCTAPAYWDIFNQSCMVYLCAPGWTPEGNLCVGESFRVMAAQCVEGSTARHIPEWGSMVCVAAPEPDPPSSTVIRREPAPPGRIRPADPPTATVRATHRLPFTVSETGSGEKSYEFTLQSSTEVSVSLTGMDRDIDCSVNGSRCSNRGGTSDDDWSGELAAGPHSVRVYPYRGGTGDYTVTATATCPAGRFAHGGSCYAYVTTSAQGGGEGEPQTCDENTDLEAGTECVDGVIVFSEEIVVVSTPIPVPRRGQPIPIPSPDPPTPSPPPLPSWVTLSMQTQLATAVADATARARSCSVTTTSGAVEDAYDALIAAQIQYDGPLWPLLKCEWVTHRCRALA
jgi:hypothetical protein